MGNPEYAEMRQQLNSQGREIAELRGNVQQLDKLASAASRQSTLQIAAIVISLCLTIAGGLYFQTRALDRHIDQIDKRIDSLEKRMDRIENRMDRIEQQLLELTKELRAQRPVR